MKIIGLRMIFRRKRKVTGNSNIFAAEIHSRNGLILFRRILVVSAAGGIPAALFAFLGIYNFPHPTVLDIK
jgi:hypothetical protein